MEIVEGNPRTMIARISKALRPDSVPFQPVVETLTDICYDVIENQVQRDRGMMSGYSRIVEVDMYSDCPEWDHWCPRQRSSPIEGLGMNE